VLVFKAQVKKTPPRQKKSAAAKRHEEKTKRGKRQFVELGKGAPAIKHLVRRGEIRPDDWKEKTRKERDIVARRVTERELKLKKKGGAVIANGGKEKQPTTWETKRKNAMCMKKRATRRGAEDIPT